MKTLWDYVNNISHGKKVIPQDEFKGSYNGYIIREWLSADISLCSDIIALGNINKDDYRDYLILFHNIKKTYRNFKKTGKCRYPRKIKDEDSNIDPKLLKAGCRYFRTRADIVLTYFDYLNEDQLSVFKKYCKDVGIYE